MNQISRKQLDNFLVFSKLYLLVFTGSFKLTGLFPKHRSFLGWDESDFPIFNFEQNFLKINHTGITEFISKFDENKYLSDSFYWRKSDGGIAGPFQTYFMLASEKKGLKTIFAFVKPENIFEKVQIEPAKKTDLFTSETLPGWLDNLSVPLDTINERLEILKNRNSQSDKYNELLQLTREVQDSVKDIHSKLIQQRQIKSSVFSLNDLLEREIHFLKSDSFFRLQVRATLKTDPEMPRCQLYYGCLSGIISEFYYYLQRFTLPDNQYLLQAETFLERDRQGIHLNLLGDYQVPPDLQLRFPVEVEGDASRIALQQVEGLDTIYLKFCLSKLSGELLIVLRKDMMKLRLTLPLPGTYKL